jgi:hypothetical protein
LPVIIADGVKRKARISPRCLVKIADEIDKARISPRCFKISDEIERRQE